MNTRAVCSAAAITEHRLWISTTLLERSLPSSGHSSDLWERWAIFMGSAGKRLGMSEETIFTRIVDGEIPSYTVYEDETTYAFLDANPLAPGHTLVIPKEPYERLSDVPPDVAADLGATVSQLAPAVEAAVDAPASLVALHDGEEAGQEVPHVHWHIVPRFADDNARAIHSLFAGADLSDDEMADVAQRIRDAQS